jgi:hypothetical protein
MPVLGWDVDVDAARDYRCGEQRDGVELRALAVAAVDTPACRIWGVKCGDA